MECHLDNTTFCLKERPPYKYLFYSSGKIHHTVIGPLEHNTVYFYRCGGQGPEFQLKTPPGQFPVTFAVAGDLGQTGWTNQRWITSTNANVKYICFPGTFHMLIACNTAGTPLMENAFEESESTSNLFYSFEVAGVHVVMLGSYTDYDELSDQYSWLKADLSKVDRKKTWLVVLFHVPWYNSNHAHQGEGDGMMVAMEPLFYAAGVDLVFTGRVHAYERSVKRVNKGKSDPCGAVHITIGDGGNRDGLAQKYVHPKPEWSVFREASFGHGELKIVNSTHAFWSWHWNDDD
ncbi:Purple acid phosphatase 18 [Hibiscus syriacus]|uniref:Purple acid phosphatase 18 n=1 Tax=Hibiscus syriacus TaxID=106335 RepID=A0A6A3CDK3_HIBSY|nr:Purple acid phosphatase 18 [Hibiscus syriacus]